MADFERFEHAKENLNQRLQQLDRDSQIVLEKERQSHEEDVKRLSDERVSHSVCWSIYICVSVCVSFAVCLCVSVSLYACMCV